MPMSRAQVDQLKVTGTAKFSTQLSAVADATYRLFTTQEKFGSEGYVPTMLSGLGAGQAWLTTRVLHPMTEYGVKYTGKVYENSVKMKNTQVADAIEATAANVATAMANDSQVDRATRAIDVLKTNPNGFDGDPLFGEHVYSTAVGAPVYTNDLATDGTNQPWFLLNDTSLIEATRTDEDTVFAVNGGTEDSYLGFHEDAIAMGWRHRKIFAPGFWANAIRSRAALTSENLRAAMTAQSKFKNDAGRRIGAKAKYLAVGHSNAAAAEKLIKAALIDGGNTNLDLGRLQLIVLDELED